LNCKENYKKLILVKKYQPDHLIYWIRV